MVSLSIVVIPYFFQNEAKFASKSNVVEISGKVSRTAGSAAGGQSSPIDEDTSW